MPKHTTDRYLLPGMGPEPPGGSGDDPATGKPQVVATPQAAKATPRRVSQGQQAAQPSGSKQPDSLSGQTVYVIDANSLIFQVFHAIPEMTSPRGEPVNALYGFTRDLLYLLEQKRPDYLFCAFDLPGPTFRHTLYADYKADRSEMPEDLIPQMAFIRRMIDALGVPTLELESYEADDILATVARRAEALSGECYLVTADKDCRQLISDAVKIYNVRKDAVYDAEALQAEWGIRPNQVVDFQSLVGDPTDNVPGVPLIGPKIAGELLKKYGTLESVFGHVEEVSGPKRKKNLLEGRQQAMLSRQLVRLEAEVPIAIDWNRGRVGNIQAGRALEVCREFGLRSLGEQLRSLDQAAAPPKWRADYRLVDTPEALAKLIAELAAAQRFSVDTETTSLRPSEAEIVGYAFCCNPGEAYYVAVRGPAGQRCLDPDTTLEALRPLLQDASKGKVGQNLKYDMVVLRAAGVEMAGIVFDTMVASYLLDAGERNHSLDELSLRYLNHTTIKIKELIGSGKNQKRMDEVPIEQVASYAGEDADVPLRLLPILNQKLDEAGLQGLFVDVELPLVEVLAELESNGIKIDTERLGQLSERYGRQLAELEEAIYQLAGHPFNIASPKQLQTVLFQEQGLPVLARTKTGARTDVGVLEELARRHPLPAKIIEYRQYAKLKGTYVDALPALVNPRTQRVHASFHQAVAATGRLSSSDPNLQNIPIRTEQGREIRSAFLPGYDGWQLLAADYSQIELRVLAHFSKDETLCHAFACDEDIHTTVASQIHGVPPEEVTPDMRRSAKAVNFGVIYGRSPFGLAKALGIEQAEAARFINAYFARYRGIDEFLVKILEDCRANGYVSTILGRRRAIRGIGAVSDRQPRDPREARLPDRQRSLPERTAINTVIQGSAADLIKLAMIAIHRRLRRESSAAKMLLQIHDELIFEAPTEQLDSLAQLVREEMCSVMQLRVPLKVDIKTGHNWQETEPWG